MSPSLAIYILAVGSLLSSLASFPETTNLALEESPISKYLADSSLGPAVTNLRTSLSSLAEATGYLLAVGYADSLCKTPNGASTILLNGCRQINEKEYYSYTATSSTIRGGVYTDSQCKVAKNVTEKSYPSGVCFNKTILSISSTNKWTTDLSTVVLR
jgi:hypothetical protein